MSYFKRHSAQEQPERLFIRPVQDDYEQDDDFDDSGYESADSQDSLHRRRQDNLRLVRGISDLLAVVAGVVAILLLVMVLISLINWLQADVNRFLGMLGEGR